MERQRCSNEELTKCEYCKYKNDCDRQEKLEKEQATQGRDNNGPIQYRQF